VQQVHLAHAFEMLARGESVGAIARTLGYASPSAFTSMFRRLLGRTPQHYLAEWRSRA
jgi:AraC-like DNA-binding protein